VRAHSLARISIASRACTLRLLVCAVALTYRHAHEWAYSPHTYCFQETGAPTYSHIIVRANTLHAPRFPRALQLVGIDRTRTLASCARARKPEFMHAASAASKRKPRSRASTHAYRVRHSVQTLALYVHELRVRALLPACIVCELAFACHPASSFCTMCCV